ncbi:MAG: hypothetical protein AB7D96_02205 [Arcobacteraceae bacterium]
MNCATSFKPCPFVIQATALGISPIFIQEYFIAVENVKKIMLLDEPADKETFIDIHKSMNINHNKNEYSVKEFIGILSFAIRAGKVHYKNGKQRIKNIYFYKKSD